MSAFSMTFGRRQLFTCVFFPSQTQFRNMSKQHQGSNTRDLSKYAILLLWDILVDPVWLFHNLE